MDDNTKHTTLAPREMETLRFIDRGYTRDEIAEFMGISPMTVKTHMLKVVRKLGAHGAMHAAAVARKIKILPADEPKPGTIDLDRLSVAQIRWIADDVQYADPFVVFNGRLRVDLREWQMVASNTRDPHVQMVQLSGWVTRHHADFAPDGQQMVLSAAVLPGRSCPTGHKVDVTVTQHGKEYGTGLFLRARWPKAVRSPGKGRN